MGLKGVASLAKREPKFYKIEYGSREKTFRDNFGQMQNDLDSWKVTSKQERK